MDFRLLWKTHLTRPNEKIAVRSVCYKPDYSQIIAACSNDLFFISPETGEILEQKRAHRATVYCVKCSHDGTFFASASSDGLIVIWRSLNNEGYVRFGSPAATSHIEWCPNKQLLIATSKKEYRMWRPEESSAIPKQVQNNIESIAFSPNGDVFVLAFDNGLLHVISTEEPQNVLQTFTYSSIVTALSFCSINEEDYLVTADLECRVSMYRMKDKQLVGKNSLPFEAMCCAAVGDSSFFFVFAGISGKVSLLTSSLSYLGDFKSSSDWVWDVAVDKRGRIALASKEGFVELRSVDFGIAFASAGDIVAYRNSVNTMIVKNIINGKSTELSFNKIIVSTTMSSNFLLVQFKDSVISYRHEYQTESEDQQSLNIEKVFEIPGYFENAKFAITRIHILCAEDNILKFFDLTGHSLCQFQFSSPITCLNAASAYNDNAIVGCKDGRVFFVTIDMKEPVLLAKHGKEVVDAKRSGLIVAVLDVQENCTVYDSFERTVLKKLEKVKSIAFSDRVEQLLATSTGTELTIHYKDCQPITQFIEGDILGFIRNKVILSNEGAVETADAVLPFDELVQNKNWDAIKRLCDIGPNREQLEFLATASIRDKRFDVARLVAPEVSKTLSFFVNEVLVNTPKNNVSTAISQFLGDTHQNYSLDKSASQQRILGKEQSQENIHKSPKSSQGTNDTIDEEVFTLPDDNKLKKDKAIELEQSGASEEALQAYADAGEWEDVFRLAEEKHMERAIVDYEFPQEHTERAAKIMLSAGLGEGAIRLLKRTHNYASLAKARIYLGQWVEAISLSRLYSTVYNIVYPRFGELLFESGHFFESLVCFFIPKEHDDRAAAFQKMIACCAESQAFEQLSFIFLMISFNEPEMYWDYLQRTSCYLAAHQLKNKTLLPMSNDDVKSIFYMAYYLLASLSEFPLIGVSVPDVLLQLLISAVALHMKRWVSYALKEISLYKLDDKTKQIAQRAAHSFNETKDDDSMKISFECPRCHRDIFQSTRVPTLRCGSCGMKIAFSAVSCQPIPLVAFSYKGENGPELIKHEPGVAAKEEIPADVVSEKFLLSQPAELFVIQEIKKKAEVSPALWYNPSLANIHVCSTCGTMLTDEDFESTTLENEQCPICHTTLIEGAKHEDQQNDILEMLRPFEEESPVTF